LKACKDYLDDATILVKKYHTSYKSLLEALAQRDFAKKDSYAILVKDYWAHSKTPEESVLNLRVNISSPA
jgi:hypothetical protein